MSDVGGIPVERCTLSLPRFGAWRAVAKLIGGSAPTGPVSLTVGDLVLEGTVLRGGLDDSDDPSVTVVGAPGWDRAIRSPLSYQSDGGVRLRTVLADLSTRAAEPIDQPGDVSLGQAWAIPAAGRLRDALAALHRAGRLERWRVDPDGVTRFGARAGAEVTSRAEVLKRDQSLSQLEVGIDSVADMLPGNLLEGATILRVLVHESRARLYAEVWT